MEKGIFRELSFSPTYSQAPSPLYSNLSPLGDLAQSFLAYTLQNKYFLIYPSFLHEEILLYLTFFT